MIPEFFKNPSFTAMATPDRGWVILAVSWPLFSICTILVALRVWVRTRIIRSWGWDDPFIILAMLCAGTNTILVTLSAHYGTGRHALNLTDYEKIQSTKFNWLSQGFHVMSTNWGKVSVGLFLLRIIQKVKHHRPVMYGGIVLLTIINTVCVYTIYGQCTPTAKLWDSDVEGSCWNPNLQKNYAFFQGCMFSPSHGGTVLTFHSFLRSLRLGSRDIPPLHDLGSTDGDESQNRIGLCTITGHNVSRSPKFHVKY